MWWCLSLAEGGPSSFAFRCGEKELVELVHRGGVHEKVKEPLRESEHEFPLRGALAFGE